MKYLFFILFLSLSTHYSFSQILINEISSNNLNTIVDEFGEPSDWVELYNTGTEAVNLKDWYLSDKEEDPFRWKFPNVVIQPNDYLVIFASDKDLQAVNTHTNFRLSSRGEEVLLTSPTGVLIDQIQFPKLPLDISFGRMPNGSQNWVYMTPSPNTENEPSFEIEQTPKPRFSKSVSFQNESFLLEISCDVSPCEIRFTLDGSPPDSSSIIYENPILIDKNTPVRAFAFSPNRIYSKETHQTYFINVHHTLPIITLSADPFLLFDETEGLLVSGPNAESNWPYWGSNFWLDTEIPVRFEYFDEDGNYEIGFDLGMRTHGGRGARTKPQKPLRFMADPEFGDNKMNYKFFKNKETDSFERIVLRNSSGDFNAAHFRSGFLSNYMINNDLNLDLLAYQPTIIYINGEYWGIMNVREKSDEFYFESNYGIAPTEVDVLEEDTLVVAGNYDYFNPNFDFVNTHDMSDDADFEQAAQYFDMNNVAEYFIAQTAINNTDWPQGNLKFWRERTPDAKWRYLMFDMDTSTDRFIWTRAERDGLFRIMDQFGPENRHVELLKKFLQNEGFRHYFISRYADLLNTVFRAEIFSEAVADAADVIRAEMPAHFDRWGGCIVCYPGCVECFDFMDWDTLNVPEFIDFTIDREDFARQGVQDFFELPNQVELTLKTYPENAGLIKINTITPQNLPWDGWYFNGVPVSLTIESNPNFEFSHWQSLSTILDQDFNESIAYNFEKSDTITAYFESVYEGLALSAYPNPTEGEVEVSFTLNQIEDVGFQLFSIDGKLLRTFPNRRLGGGLQKIELSLAGFEAGLYFLSVETGEISETVKIFAN